MAKVIPIGRGCPEPPDYLDDEAAEIWRKLAPGLWRRGHLDQLSYSIFAILCSMVTQCSALARLVDENPCLKEGLGLSMRTMCEVAESFFLNGNELLRRFGGN